MNFYLLRDWEDRIVHIAASMDEMKAVVREFPAFNPEDLVVHLHDVPTDKDNIRKMLAQALTEEDVALTLGQPNRVWNVTKRRGLKEIDVDA